MYLTKEELKGEFKNAMENMMNNHDEYGVYYWTLEADDENRYAIVLGWQDGFDEDLEDKCSDGTYHLCSKFAYQPLNSLMQCDYDIDWLMPYDTETMEVYDNEMTIYEGMDTDEVIDWLLKCYNGYMEMKKDEYEQIENKTEKYKMFYYKDKCLGGYTLRGTFYGEEEATKKSFAFENGINIEDIEVRIEER